MQSPALEHAHLTAMRARHPEWVWNRSDTHVILSVPGSSEGMKTPVEPGNSFSPGAGSYGVSTWVFDHGRRRLHAPEQMALGELSWRLEEDAVPVLISSWQAGPVQVQSCLFSDGDPSTSAITDYLTVELMDPGESEADVSLYLVVRSFGAAGGPVRHLAWRDGGPLQVNHFPLIYPDTAPTAFGAVSYQESGEDIGTFLSRGELPEAQDVEDPSTWASGALEYRLRLAPGEARAVAFALPVKADDRFLTWVAPPQPPLEVAAREQDFTARWRRQQTISLDVPDPRFKEAFFAQLTHLAMFTVHDAPRISPISYPVWWLRDGVYVVTALDRGGYHDFAARACRASMDRDTFGGFGAEGDGPGESLWMLTERYLLSRDEQYLRDVYPHLVRKAELLMAMRRAERPLFRHAEHVVPRYALAPYIDLTCAPARDGLIMGRMDGHFPIFWANGFAYLGLTRAAQCAEAMGADDDSARFAAEAQEVRAALDRAADTEFGKNARDLVSAVWPTGWAAPAGANTRRCFQEYWDRVRCPQGEYRPEPLWTYFEAGQAHNYLYLGERDKVWQTIEHFLTVHTAPGLYTYHESNGDENSFLLWQHTRGWDRIPCVTPHGWTAAELFHLLRDCLLYENGDALVIGAGVPEAWITASEPFGVTGAPSHFGAVSWRYDPRTRSLEWSAERPPAGGVVSRLPGGS